MGLGWMTLVGLGTAFYCAGGQPGPSDGIGFGCSLGIALAASAIAAFASGGRRRWAIEVALSVLLVSLVLGLLLGYFLWFDTTLARRRLTLHQVWGIQSIPLPWLGQVASYHGPLGVIVGSVLGTITGLLTVLARRRFGPAMGISLVILFAFATDSGRRTASELVDWLGLRLRYYLIPHSFSDDQISITGMILGAIAGSVIAGIAMHVTRRR